MGVFTLKFPVPADSKCQRCYPNQRDERGHCSK
jgi:hypothetical protein